MGGGLYVLQCQVRCSELNLACQRSHEQAGWLGLGPGVVGLTPTFCLVLSAPSRSESLVKGAPVIGSAFGFVASHAHQCRGLGPSALMLPLRGVLAVVPGGPSPAVTLNARPRVPGPMQTPRLPPRLSNAWAVLTVAVELRKKPKL